MLEKSLQSSIRQDLQFETTASFGQEPSWWVENGPDALIISLPPDDLMQGYYLNKLRNDVPRSLPVLLLSSTVSASLMQLSQIFMKVRMLKTPVDGAVMVRTVVEMVTNWGPGREQTHPRYMTDQEIKITSESTPGNSLAARMKNLSLSGAYFESENRDSHFNPGDYIKLVVMTGEPLREHSFDARIVWIKPIHEQGRGFGVTFVNKEDVYNHLLKGF